MIYVLCFVREKLETLVQIKIAEFSKKMDMCLYLEETKAAQILIE